MNRHIIIRAIIAVIWIAVGIIKAVHGNMLLGATGILMAAAFGYSAYILFKKDKK